MARHQPLLAVPLALALCLVLASAPGAEGQTGRELVGEEQGSYLARALAGLQSGAAARQTSATASAIAKPKMVKVKGSGKGKAKAKGAEKKGATTAAASATATPVATTETNTTETSRNTTETSSNTTETSSNTTETSSNTTETSSNTTTTSSNTTAAPSAPSPPAPNPPSVSAAVAQWRAYRASKVFANPVDKNAVANIGKTWSYSFRLGGSSVVGPIVEEGDPLATGTVDMSVTMLKQSLFSDGHPTYQIKATITLKGLSTAGFPTRAVLKRGAQHSEGKMLLPFPGTFTATADGAVLTSVVGDTSAVWSEFQVPATAAMKYLILFPGHHYVEVFTVERPKGAIRGQLVKVLDAEE